MPVLSVRLQAVENSSQLFQLRSQETAVVSNNVRAISDADRFLDTVLYQENTQFAGIKRIIIEISLSFLNTNSDIIDCLPKL